MKLIIQAMIILYNLNECMRNILYVRFESERVFITEASGCFGGHLISYISEQTEMSQT